MKSKPPFVPPDPLNGVQSIEPPDSLDKESFKSSPAYKKYVEPVKRREEEFKISRRREWWKANWINLLTLFIAILTLLATIWFGLRPAEQPRQQEQSQCEAVSQDAPKDTPDT